MPALRPHVAGERVGGRQQHGAADAADRHAAALSAPTVELMPERGPLMTPFVNTTVLAVFVNSSELPLFAVHARRCRRYWVG